MSGDDQTPSLVDRVLVSTRHRILTGEYPPGMRLRLNHLAEESGVSLIPVREALRVLEAERLVRTVPNKGASVAELSMEDLNDLYSVRIQLESEALASSKPLTDVEVEALETVLAEMAVADAAGDTARTMRLHRSFHFQLYERSESSWLPFLIDILWKHAERYQWLSLHVRRDVAGDEHRAIVRALHRGEMTEAAEAMRSHLDMTRSLIENAYSEVVELQPAES
jgi:DNA-binding GntR family transcriptional regulator